MLKSHPNTLAPLLGERNKQIMLNLHITLIRLKKHHLRWSTSSISSKNSVYAHIKLGIC